MKRCMLRALCVALEVTVPQVYWGTLYVLVTKKKKGYVASILGHLLLRMCGSMGYCVATVLLMC